MWLEFYSSCPQRLVGLLTTYLHLICHQPYFPINATLLTFINFSNFLWFIFFCPLFVLPAWNLRPPSLYLRYLPALVPFFFLYLAAFHIMTAFYFFSSKHCFLPSHASCSKHIFFKRHTWSYFSDADWTWKIEMPPTLFFCCCVLIQRTILFFSIGWKLLTMHFYYELANI